MIINFKIFVHCITLCRAVSYCCLSLYLHVGGLRGGPGKRVDGPGKSWKSPGIFLSLKVWEPWMKMMTDDDW